MPILTQQRFLRAAILVTFCTVAIASSAAGNPPPDTSLRQHPTGGKTPVVVVVGLYITNLVAIDETRESFEVGGYLTAQWNDSRLALPSGGTADNGPESTAARQFRVEDIWTPPVEGANTISHKTNSYSLTVDRNGTVTYVERFDSVLSNAYSLRKFPFDSQTLRFEYQPFLASASDIRFAPQPLPSTGVSPDQHNQLAAWRVLDLRYSAKEVRSNGVMPESPEGLFEIVIKRRYGFYIWKIFMPLMMMVMIPSVAFWIDPKEFDWLLKLPLTMLLSMVAFQFTAVRDLPRVEYLTFLDAVFLMSFAFFFIAIVEITVAYLMQRGSRRPLAVKIHSAGRWAYPMAYFGILLLLAIGFLA